VIAVGLGAIAIAALVVLLQSAPRRSGTNLTTNTGFVVPLGGGQQLCEPGELIPAGTGALRVAAAVARGSAPALEGTLQNEAGAVIAAGRLHGRWRAPGVIDIPVRPATRETAGGTVCVRNLGAPPVSFGGSTPDGSFVITIAGHPFDGRLRIEYMRPGSETWLALAPTLAHRFSLAKGDLVRHWAIYATLLLIALAIALAARTLIREERAG